MKKLLLIGPLPKPITGQSLANQILRDGLIERGLQVDVLDTKTTKGIENFNKQGKFSFFKIFISVFQNLIGIFMISLKKYDLIYLTPGQTYFGFVKNIFFIIFGYFTGKKIYIHFHGGLFGSMYKELSKNKKKVINYIFQRINGVIVLSESLVVMVDNLVLEKNIFICQNGIENKFLIDEVKQRKEKIQILYLSNLMETKGILDLLEATKHFDLNNIDYELNLAGDVEKGILTKIKVFLKNDKIKFHGIVDGKVKYDLLKNSTIFCLPTYYPVEGQPISIMEAMGMGNAIVTTDQGGIKDIIKDGVNGVICEKKNPKSIYESIVKAQQNFEIFSTNNIKEVREKYTQEKFVNRIYKVLNGEKNENINNNS